MHGNRNFPGVRTYHTLAEVEDHYKAFRGISKLAEQGEQQKCVIS